MKYVVLTSRILLGLNFSMAAVAIFMPEGPPPPGLAGTALEVLYSSHWIHFVYAVEALGGVLLLTNRFVPLALTLLGAVLANVLTYHLTMHRGDIALPIAVTVLWTIVAIQYRKRFVTFFTAGPDSRPCSQLRTS